MLAVPAPGVPCAVGICSGPVQTSVLHDGRWVELAVVGGGRSRRHFEEEGRASDVRLHRLGTVHHV